MKQFFVGVIKFLVVLSVIAGIMYAVVRHWDNIVTAFGRFKSAITGKCCRRAEYDDYAD